MRKFNEREKALIREFTALDAAGSVSMQKFLQDVYLRKELSRALIIQNEAEYACFFLATAVYDDEQKRNAELKQFFELITLIHYLNRSGYITLYKEKKEKMYFIQDGFNAVKIVNNNYNNKTIVLNTNGDNTTVPDAIHDIRKNVIYKGLEFRSEQYRVIHDATVGTLLVTDQLKELLSDEPLPATSQLKNQPKTKTNTVKQMKTPLLLNEGPAARPFKEKLARIRRALPLFLSVLCILLLIAAGIFTGIKMKRYDQYIADLHASTDSLRDGMKNMTGLISTLPPPKTATAADSDSAVLYGLDLSKWNGNIAELIQRKDSIAFMICRATIGLTDTDHNFNMNWNAIQQKNCLLGAYHFYYAKDDPIQQADHFYNTVNALGQTDLPLIVDIEQKSLATDAGTDVDALQENLLKFLRRLELKHGKVPMIYTDEAFANEYLDNTEFAKYPLWLAEYTDAPKPEIPGVWETAGYRVWQKKDNYHIDMHTADFDVFYGRKSELCR